MNKIVALKRDLKDLKEEARNLASNDDATVEEIQAITEEIEVLQNQINRLEAVENRYSNDDDENLEPLNKKGGDQEPMKNFIKRSKINNKADFRKAFLDKDEASEIEEVKDVTLTDCVARVTDSVTGVNTDLVKNTAESVIIPDHIVSDLLYESMPKSVLLGTCPTVRMKSYKTKIGKVNSDGINLEFKAPYALGAESNLGIEGIELVARTLYSYIEVSDEDMQDIDNLEEVLKRAFSDGIAKSFDRAFLYNQFESGVSEEDKAKFPKGVMDNPAINKITVPAVDYDMIGKGVLEVAKKEGTPNIYALNPIISLGLQMTKDTQGQYIVPPKFMEDLQKIESNNLKVDDGLVFEDNAIVIGVRKDISFSKAPAIKNGTLLLAVKMRADVAVTKADHVTKITVEK